MLLGYTSLQYINRCTPARIIPYPRDGSFGWCFSRHFVPGYDRTVPGRFAQALDNCCCERSGSVSRRDNTDRSLARSAWVSIPRKHRPVGYGMIDRTGTSGSGSVSRRDNTDRSLARSAWLTSKAPSRRVRYDLGGASLTPRGHAGLPPGPGHRGHEWSVGSDDLRIRHVQ